MRMRQENSFASNSFKERKFFKKLFAIVSPLRLCNCVKKFVSSSLKLEAGKMVNQNSLPNLQKKNNKIQ